MESEMSFKLCSKKAAFNSVFTWGGGGQWVQLGKHPVHEKNRAAQPGSVNKAKRSSDYNTKRRAASFSSGCKLTNIVSSSWNIGERAF